MTDCQLGGYAVILVGRITASPLVAATSPAIRRQNSRVRVFVKPVPHVYPRTDVTAGGSFLGPFFFSAGPTHSRK